MKKTLAVLALAALAACSGCASSKGKIDKANRATVEHAGEAIAEIASADGKLDGAKAHADAQGVELIESAQDDLSDATDHVQEIQESTAKIDKALPGVKDKTNWSAWLWGGGITIAGFWLLKLMFTGSSITSGLLGAWGWIKSLRKK